MQTWFYIDAGKQEGPESLERMQVLLSTGRLSRQHFAWREGLTEWTRIVDLPEFTKPVPPPIPPSMPANVAPSPPPLRSADSGLPAKSPSLLERELWPAPTVAQLERRKTLFSKTIGIGLILSLILLGLGWLMENKTDSAKDVIGSYRRPDVPQTGRTGPFYWIWSIATGGPLGISGAVLLIATLCLAPVHTSLEQQLERARRANPGTPTNAEQT